MKLIQGGKSTEIAGAKVGELILIYLTTGKIEKVLLSDINKIGIDAFQVDLTTRPLTFYPFFNIIKVTKYTEIEQGR